MERRPRRPRGFLIRPDAPGQDPVVSRAHEAAVVAEVAGLEPMARNRRRQSRDCMSWCCLQWRSAGPCASAAQCRLGYRCCASDAPPDSSRRATANAQQRAGMYDKVRELRERNQVRLDLGPVCPPATEAELKAVRTRLGALKPSA